MKSTNEILYWVALAHLPKWGYEKINKFIVKILHENNYTLEEFFDSENDWKTRLTISESDYADLLQAKLELPKTSLLMEDLVSNGVEIISLNSPDYSKTLKNNLKIKAPTILYIKGNKNIMQESSIAVVGSREADTISLQFTDTISKNASEHYKVVVSGFAKGVDKQALDSAIKYKGQSIIVLPQGILTFGSGIKKYSKEIDQGDVLIVSTFHPKSVWSSGLAMARNPIIYALADEIFVAQSAESGGTWAGVLDGLKKGRTIFVRKPNEGEKNANLLLIEKGAQVVDLEGNLINRDNIINALPKVNELLEKEMMDQVVHLLEKQMLTSEQILEKIPLSITEKQLVKKIKSLPNLKIIRKTNKLYYFIIPATPTLFQ